ncbi:aminomethyl-transferring glycine dehydrogenase subunit GcvPA [Halarcobacter ebronensis]|uniref:Probable glycine dehydrogenase (decarboxylating) subunit 1 n=1 Tax=Halarcobacter ebronensis TaxID=1462615 RepID=A0A4Q1AY65_9BACT|nr:aminomethyl-transferring glycine dehydrogenase subunit GcvPA [Halarcobacter ebronensis]QKF83529.1 glycine cleavage system, glycine decarboxylase protein P1 (pyridoxal-binding) [Halarcobacter ebronensis]RXK08321.1 aminomethyl-transferring glycine dehydrogenase [Halarcobacter ebronensis]
MPYTPHTKDEIELMLQTIGIKSEEELFSSVPSNLRVDSLDIEDGLDEYTTFEKFKALASKNVTDKTIFLGGGYYDHIVPSAVDALSSRAEFYTAYTPYQAEASQGTLQVLYEYQSLVCKLTGMDVSNASMYDGATALAEAALMAVRISKKNKILIDAGVNPTYIKVVQTYLSFREIEVEIVDLKGDISDFETIESKIDDSVAGYLFQNPNFLGSIASFEKIIEKLHEKGALAVSSVYAVSLGVLKEPSSMGVDIVTADGQCLGNYLSFGGPSFGLIATKQEYIRDLPGRIIGKTVDRDGKEMFVLTMQAREQHIRRHRATSNICSNQNLLALRSTIYLSLLGKEGFVELANSCHSKSEYLKENLSKIKGVEIFNSSTTFSEFVIKTPCDASDILEAMSSRGIYAGINLGNLFEGFENAILVSVTEKRTKEQMDNYVENLIEVLGGEA